VLVGNVVDDKEFETALRHLGADLAKPLLVLVAGKRQFNHFCSMHFSTVANLATIEAVSLWRQSAKGGR
jgi:hypothetical protein